MKWLSSKRSNRLALARSYLARKALVRGNPLTLTIESTAKCNLSCPMCIRERVYFPAKNMELATFKKIIDDGRDFLEFVVPYGTGEPLLNPEIFDMIAYCSSHGIPTGISTNGTVLSEEAGRRLMEAGLNCIVFAFDGATRETFEAYRKGASFDTVRGNILRFLQMKKAVKSDIFCVVQMVALKENIKEAKAFIRMWNVEGVDDVRIKKDEIHNEGCAIPGSMTPPEPLRRPCYLLWRGPMYIHYDGTVFPCCYMYPEGAIGNIRRQSLETIWNSDKLVGLREAHIQGDLRSYKSCMNCPAAKPRLPVVLGSFLFNTQMVSKAVPFFERMAQIHNISVFETLK